MAPSPPPPPGVHGVVSGGFAQRSESKEVRGSRRRVTRGRVSGMSGGKKSDRDRVLRRAGTRRRGVSPRTLSLRLRNSGTGGVAAKRDSGSDPGVRSAKNGRRASRGRRRGLDGTAGAPEALEGASASVGTLDLRAF